MRVAWRGHGRLLLSGYVLRAGGLGVLVQEPQQLGLEPQLERRVLAAAAPPRPSGRARASAQVS